MLDSVAEFIIQTYRKAMEQPSLKEYVIRFQKEDGLYEELQESNIHMLFNLIEQQITSKKEGTVQVRLSVDSADMSISNFIEQNSQYSPVKEVEKDFNLELPAIQNGFFDKEAKDRTLDKLKRFKEIKEHIFKENKEHIYETNSNKFISKSEIRNYLNSYYSVLVELIGNEMIKDAQVREGILRPLLLMGETKNNNFNLHSPVVLNNVEKMYCGVLDFYNILFSSLREDKPMPLEIAYMYKNILRAKTQRVFRWYIYDNNEFGYVAVPPMPLETSQDFAMVVNSKSIKKCNSYEGVGELRFAEKIIDAYQKHRGAQFQIALVGDINKPVYELIKYVDDSLLLSELQKKKLIYNIYTKNKIQEQKTCRFKGDYVENIIINSYEEPEYDNILKSVDGLQEVINQNDLIFLLDCIQLYNEIEVKEEKDIFSSNLKFSSNEYFKYNNWADNPENIFIKNPLDDIYQCLTAYVAKGQFGMIEKNANQMIIKYLEEMVEKERERGKEDKTVFVYVSDLEAFGNIYSREQYYMRIEQYNEKKIGIIRFSTYQEDKLENNENGIIVLNVWQIFKHIALEGRKKILDEINRKCKLNCEYQYLHKMYIGLDYKNWNQEVNVYYNYDKKIVAKSDKTNEDYDRWMEYFIDNVLLRIFRKQSGSIYQKYCKNVIISFLYGDAKSIEDILFVHLLKRGKVNTEKFMRPKENIKKEAVLKAVNKGIRFSNKRLYDLAMQCYDVAFVNMLEEFDVTELFKEDGKSKAELKRELAQACRNIEYIDSSLYSNCN